MPFAILQKAFFLEVFWGLLQAVYLLCFATYQNIILISDDL